MKIVIEKGLGGWSGVEGCKVLRLTLNAELGGERRHNCDEFSKDKDGEEVD